VNSERALVTGGAGFIGSHIVESLADRGLEVWVLDDLSTGSEVNLVAAKESGRVHFVRGDIRKIQSVADLPREFDIVFHEAAIASVPRSISDPMLVHDVNVNGSLEVMNFSREHSVRRFIFASSAAVYGTVSSQPAHEDLPCAPGSPYGASKLSVENYMRAYGTSFGLETIALRYFNVYGPRQRAGDDYSSVIPLFARRLLNSERPTIYGDGLQTRDFVHVNDVARANMLAMESGKPRGSAINVATGRNVSILQLFDALAKIAGVPGVEPEFAPARVGDPKFGAASIDRARRLLGFEPRVSLEDGLESVVKHLRVQMGILTA
jgi:nucleoside-diphosphate-sugar epimerase